MAPEQAEPMGERVDTRTDVYSLGVVLYELLVGALPFDWEKVASQGFDRVRKTILDEEPPRPSTRLGTLGELARELARRRRVDVAALRRQLRGDLDWITLKALEKERRRRYGSPAELAADLERHLTDQPVLARPPSPAYLARKFLRRHRLGTSVAAAAVLVLVAASAILALRARRVTAQRDAAERARADLEAVAEFQTRMLSECRPGEMGRRLMADLRARAGEARRAQGASPEEIEQAVAGFDAAVSGIDRTGAALRLIDQEFLHRASAAIQDRFGAQPLLEARLRDTLGTTYRDLGLYRPAEDELVRARELREAVQGAEDPATLRTVEELADVYRRQGRFPEAETLIRQNLSLRERILGPSHPETLASASNLALVLEGMGRLPEAEALHLESLELLRRERGAEHPETLGTMNNLGVLYIHQGRFEAAERQLRETLERALRALGPEAPQTIQARMNLATACAQEGEQAEAERLYRETLAVLTRTLGEEHPDTLATMNNLAVTCAKQGRCEEAERLHLRTLELRRRVLGTDHPDTLVSMTNLSTLYFDAGRTEDAERLDEEILATRKRVLGPDHPDTLVSMNNVGMLYREIGRLGESETLLREALERRRRVSGLAHPDTEMVRRNLIQLLQDQGRDRDLEPLLREYLEAARIKAERDDASPADLNEYAWQLLTIESPELQNSPRALAVARRCCEQAEARGDGNLWNYLDTLALAWSRNGDPAAALEAESRALLLLPPDRPERAELERSRAEFEAALAAGETLGKQRP
jgi:Flp pilus assembly protein TadD